MPIRLLALCALGVAACAAAPSTDLGDERATDQGPAEPLGGGDGDSLPSDEAASGDPELGDAAPGDGDAGDGDVTTARTDFAQPGPFAVSTTAGSLAVDGCTLTYALRTPSGAASPVLVVLGHGFSRSRDNVAELAAHLASYGARVATPSYCHSWFLDTDHAQNAADAVALAASLMPQGPVIYAGHSAGGLSAVLAAASDPRALAVLGLDLTDADQLALDAASQLALAALGLFGEPSSCNASGNGRAAFAAIDEATSLLVRGASHCDFEAPTSSACTFSCGASEAARAQLVRALAAAFVAWHGGLDADGEAWVSPDGAELQRLVSAGAVSPL